jgi:hypothetical protein
MPAAITRLTAGLLLLAAGDFAGAQQVWKADIQIRTLEVTRTKSTVNARIVVYTEDDDAAEHARLLILLPVGAGIERLAAGCSATPGPSMVPSLRAAVTCEMGAIPNRGFREVLLTARLPVNARPKLLGVFTYSSTPDPVPGNNYAERIVP